MTSWEPVRAVAPGDAALIDVFRDSQGVFSMVAVDQRSSLRSMLAAGRSADSVPDAGLVAFKTAVSENLTDQASGILLDHQFGTEAAAAARCNVILAADVLSSSQVGGPVDTATLDDTVTPQLVESVGAAALKMLIPWLPERRSQAIDLTQAFLELCRMLGLPGVVEGVVRPTDLADWSDERRSEALVDAACDLAPLGCELYKTEVIFADPRQEEVARQTAAAISVVAPCPWVVLSSGVPADLFPEALAIACEAGAQGFLAGRAIWAGATQAKDVELYLQTSSRDVLRELSAVARRSQRG